MIIKSAKFIISNTDVSKCPNEPLPEYAFIGRSNVGKSSLINMLMNNNKLAKTSGTPGKTQLINHFKINDNWFLVDLPGYGYAKVSKSQRNTFQKFIKGYFLERQQLRCTFILIDTRIPPQKIDLEFMAFLAENQLPFCMVFTKTDKLNRTNIQKNTLHYKSEMLENNWESMPHFFLTSSATAVGKEELLQYIDQTNKLIL